MGRGPRDPEKTKRIVREERERAFVWDLREATLKEMRKESERGTTGSHYASVSSSSTAIAVGLMRGYPCALPHCSSSGALYQNVTTTGSRSAKGFSGPSWHKHFNKTGFSTLQNKSGKYIWLLVCLMVPTNVFFLFSLSIHSHFYQFRNGLYINIYYYPPCFMLVTFSIVLMYGIFSVTFSFGAFYCLSVTFLTVMEAPQQAVSVVMDPPGGRDERHRQAERLRREEAYYHFINELSEEEYRLMRDSNLLGTPGEVTAEELRQRLDGAKERVSSQPRPEPRPQNSEAEGSSETSNGDSLLEWLNTFRRTGNATRSGQSGNQTWQSAGRESRNNRNLTSSSSPTHSNNTTPEESRGSTAVAVEMGEAVVEPAAPADPLPEAGEEEGETPAAGGGGVRRHPTIMLDLQVRRIRPGENRDRDSIASRTRSRARAAENTVTFESDSGGFRRTISRSERAGIRTYVSTIRIPLRRISETGLGEPSSTALRSILRQIMTGFGELSSLMETEANSEAPTPNQDSALGAGGQTFRVNGSEGGAAHVGVESAQEGLVEAEEEGQVRVNRTGNEGRPNSRDTNNLVENGTLPILRLAHFFLLNEDEDEEHPRGLTKEQIDNLVTRTYGQVNLEGEQGRACSVCINEYAQGNKLRRLPCAHEFHIHCIDRWLSENNTCPICRQPILIL
ncbi:E3 ubiquitin-protein ligase RNF6 [Triplophysa tibetana]|uniref:RING-type E3 ubiquitin transferase n=1 Tax=Triplophysa tibetana TaxID=1572043 RepID=A0A5A9N4B7_9TELE|nr:E3 ubiquitin-protein ligase RNF6 [Triplophysa tibetana]